MDPKPPKTRTLLWTLSFILVLLVVYALGIVVGYRRATFETAFDDHYSRTFNVGMMLNPPMMPHGVIGRVIDIATGTLSVRDPFGNEVYVLIASGTTVREFNEDVSAATIANGDNVAVIGEPDADGDVEARFIRLFRASSTVIQ